MASCTWLEEAGEGFLTGAEVMAMTRDRRAEADVRPRQLMLANAAHARVLERDPDTGALRELADAVHTASRLRPGQLGHDRPGRGARGAQKVVFAPVPDLAQREQQHFAESLARQLEAQALAGELPAWALLASNPFLGRLRAVLGPQAAGRLVMHLDRDLTSLPLHELEPRLRSLIPPGAPEAPAGAAG